MSRSKLFSKQLELSGFIGLYDLMELKPSIMEEDFQATASGTLIAGQWFSKNANTDRVAQGEWPLFLVPVGVLHKVSWAYRRGQLVDSESTGPLAELCQHQHGQKHLIQSVREFLARTARKIQHTGWYAFDSGAYHPEPRWDVCDEIGTRYLRGESVHALFRTEA